MEEQNISNLSNLEILTVKNDYAKVNKLSSIFLKK